MNYTIYEVPDGTTDAIRQPVNGKTPEEAILAYKEFGCEHAELSFPGDEEAVDRNQQEIYDMVNDLMVRGYAHSEFFDFTAFVVDVSEGQVACLCYDIDWDEDDFEATVEDNPSPLPTMLIIHASVDTEDLDEDLSDALTQVTGFCHRGFKSRMLP